MTKLFISIYRYFHKHQWQMWLSMVALFVVTGFFASQIHLEEDLNKLMPSSKSPDGTTKMAFADLRIKAIKQCRLTAIATPTVCPEVVVTVNTTVKEDGTYLVVANIADDKQSYMDFKGTLA